MHRYQKINGRGREPLHSGTQAPGSSSYLHWGAGRTHQPALRKKQTVTMSLGMHVTRLKTGVPACSLERD